MPDRRTHLSLMLTLLLVPGLEASPRAALEAGNQALRAGRFEEAKNHFAGGFVEDPEAPSLHYSMGLVHLREGQPEKAAPFFERAAALAEKAGARRLAARSRYNLGLCLAGEAGGQASPSPGGPAGAGPASGGTSPTSALPMLQGPPAGGASPALPAGFPGAPGGDLEGALKAFRKSIELDPADLDAKYNFLEIQRRLQQQEQQEQEQQENQDSEDQDQQDQDQEQQEQNQDQSQNQGDGQQQGDQGQSDSQGKQDPGQQGQDEQEQPQQSGGPEDPGEGEEQSGEPPPEGPEGSQGLQRPPRDQGSSGSSGSQSPEPQEMDRQAMEQILDALAADEKEQMERFLRSRMAPRKEVKHDW